MKTMILFAALLTSFAGFSASTENAEDLLGVRSAAHMTGGENCNGTADYNLEAQGNEGGSPGGELR